MEIFDASEFVTDRKHRISLHESRRRLNMRSTEISRLKKRVAELTRQLKELRQENKMLAGIVNAMRNVLQEGGAKKRKCEQTSIPASSTTPTNGIEVRTVAGSTRTQSVRISMP